MTNHPNRGRRSPASNPLPDEIRRARESTGLTQQAAAAVIHASLRAWQQWEAGDRRMHPAFWELFKIKTGYRCEAAEGTDTCHLIPDL